MMPVLVGLLLAAMAALGAAAGAHLRYAAGGRAADRAWALALAAVGWTLLSVGGLARMAWLGRFAYGTFAESLLLLAWAATFGYLWLAWRWRLTLGGAILLPGVTLMLALALRGLARPPAATWLNAAQHPWLATHVALAVAAYASFVLSGLAAGLYLWAEGQLKAKRFACMRWEVPPLDVLAGLTVGLAGLGFLFLSLALGLGMWGARMVWGSYLPPDPKIAGSLVLWLVYGAYLAAWWTRGYQGRRAAVWAVVALLGVIVNYVGITWLSEVHRF